MNEKVFLYDNVSTEAMDSIVENIFKGKYQTKETIIGVERIVNELIEESLMLTC